MTRNTDRRNKPCREALIEFQGGDDNLGVILGTYEPDVQCMGTHVGWDSCLEILGDMPATTEPKVFGLEGQPGVEEVLPMDLVSGTVHSISKIDPN